MYIHTHAHTNIHTSYMCHVTHQVTKKEEVAKEEEVASKGEGEGEGEGQGVDAGGRPLAGPTAVQHMVTNKEEEVASEGEGEGERASKDGRPPAGRLPGLTAVEHRVCVRGSASEASTAVTSATAVTSPHFLKTMFSYTSAWRIIPRNHFGYTSACPDIAHEGCTATIIATQPPSPRVDLVGIADFRLQDIEAVHGTFIGFGGSGACFHDSVWVVVAGQARIRAIALYLRQLHDTAAA
eukprot:GDKI01032501.1.p1 GENE.GDKI01032501.1~~GDKI01032501.1.p1  ORF type:complete len:238 (+),score=44.73 GDKI01032501.1:202-915(+)